jgi:hypothetical protein
MDCFLKLEGCEQKAIAYGYRGYPDPIDGKPVCASCGIRAGSVEMVPMVPKGMELFYLSLEDFTVPVLGQDKEDAKRRLRNCFVLMLRDTPNEKPRK